MLSEVGIFYGEEKFHAAVKISRHEVRASNEEFVVSSILEIKTSGMLKEPSDMRGDGNGFTEPRHARAQSAHASYEQCNCYAGLRGAIEGLNAGFVYDGIHFENERAVAVFSLSVDFAVDSRDKLFTNASRRDEQFGVGGFFGISGEGIKQIGHILAYHGIAGEKTQVCIDFAGRRIVISCSEMQVPTNAV